MISSVYWVSYSFTTIINSQLLNVLHTISYSVNVIMHTNLPYHVAVHAKQIELATYLLKTQISAPIYRYIATYVPIQL